MAESFSSGESADWLSNLHQQAIDHFHRVALVLSGEKDWCYSNADYIIKMQGFESVLTISENMSAGISSRKARTQLGKEYDAIAFDAYHAFDIDAFAAVSGTLCGGGFLILIVPEESNWQELKTSRFLQRALPDIKNYQGVYFIRQNEELPEFQESDFPDRDYYNVELPYRTVEQKQVINAIQASILRSSNTPVVLISDRGRG
ncbi:MAG: DUF1726 domain-containing protein, partial [Gammaproteobacteria bacterium]|nr:DUF1726 domain-containing protein [Gammaproteobacteria bacterium]